MTKGLIGDSLFGVALNDSLIQSANEPLCDTVREVVKQGFQTNSFERWSLEISVIACVVAVITCVVAVFQLRHQIKQFNESQEKDDEVRKETKTYINQIRTQILSESLLRIVDKKNDFQESYKIIDVYLSGHITLLYKDLADKCDAMVLLEIKKIKYHINVIEDTICFFDKEHSLKNKSIEFVGLLEKIEKQERICESLEAAEFWLGDFRNKKNELIQAIDNSYNSIKQSVIQ